ncbi:MAG: hypothetical protein B7X53_14935 [Hyphomonas sp. 34-62-18]|nr:SDR family oxidoreductase [Hyphomonas sp. 34-62-18]OYW88486.1 MAG: hypothetical protein B7Z22_02305 [Hyphomonas sp. 32-62-5]OZB13957.1 MAG: hypothetical protein B7X53_14935 [Hyphomonas sp. 34-62-18]
MAQPVTLVLGLGRETGEAIARRFEDEGHRVLAADPSLERIEAARDSLDETIQFYHGDLSTKLGLRNAVTAAVEAYGRIDNAVVVPPYEEPDSLLDFTQEKFEKALGRTARGAALALRVIAEHLLDQEDLPETGVERKRQKGAITFILRYAAVSSMPGRFTDTVSQAAIQGVMRAGALELAQHNIRVNAIVSLRPSEERATPWSLGRVPLGRAVLADEIAAAAYFMASAETAFLTGQSLILDGGRSTLSGVLD